MAEIVKFSEEKDKRTVVLKPKLLTLPKSFRTLPNTNPEINKKLLPGPERK
jgi:hypothetical protein